MTFALVFRHARWVSIAALMGCGGASHPAPAPAPADDAVPDAPAGPSPEELAQQRLDQLHAALEPIEPDADVPTTFGRAFAACPQRRNAECALSSIAGYDARGSSWIVFDVDENDGGPKSLWLGSVTPAQEQSVAQCEVSDATCLPTTRRAIGTYRRLRVASNAVERVAWTQDDPQASRYVALVALGAPAAGWLLWVETTDLDTAQYVLRMSPPDRSSVLELARVPARVDACTSEGWTCADAPDQRCTVDQMRAQHRLCVRPVSLGRVAFSPDGSTLFVGGSVTMAGDDAGYPPFHSVVETPPALREADAPVASAP